MRFVIERSSQKNWRFSRFFHYVQFSFLELFSWTSSWLLYSILFIGRILLVLFTWNPLFKSSLWVISLSRLLFFDLSLSLSSNWNFQLLNVFPSPNSAVYAVSLHYLHQLIKSLGSFQSLNFSIFFGGFKEEFLATKISRSGRRKGFDQS